MGRYFLGAYAASPCLPGVDPWYPDQESDFLAGLRDMPGIQGLEIPFYGQLHAVMDSQWFLSRLHPRWRHVLTCIPGTMNRLKADPEFGLASSSSDGRKAALSFMADARRAVDEINAFFGVGAVKAVEVHSAPTQGPSGRPACWRHFSQSLAEIRSWDWQGAEILVEHCDAFSQKQVPAKGFLSLENEILAIQNSGLSGAPSGLVINWARSVIEGRSAHTAELHIQKAMQAKLLAGLFFSGCTAHDPVYGDWADSHAPFAPLLATSLLTSQEMKRCLAACGKSGRYRGVKIQTLPKSLTVEQRLRVVNSALLQLDAAVAETEASILQ